MERIEVKECHNYLLQIAKSFHDICEKHRIPYYMLGGTQLGAIRHKGFIPWDDDMDFGVPRPYYQELYEVLERELPKDYKVISIYNSPSYSNGFFKIEDSRTLIKEIGVPGLKKGLNIDIFPLDYTNNKHSFFSKNYWISTLSKFETYFFADMENLNWFQKAASVILKKSKLIKDNKTIFNYINGHLLLTSGNYMVNHYGAYGLKEIINKEIFGTPTLYVFEDTELFGIERFDEYLSHFYGNYMELPKGKSYHFHIEELYLK